MLPVEFAEDTLRDLELIFDHLVESYRGFGEAPDEASERAAARVRGIVAAADRLALAPHRGAVRDDLAPGIRHLTFDRAVCYFRVDGLARPLAIVMNAVRIGVGGRRPAPRLPAPPHRSGSTFWTSREALCYGRRSGGAGRAPCRSCFYISGI
jgi:plasmid stabilization system protein ParE